MSIDEVFRNIIQKGLEEALHEKRVMKVAMDYVDQRLREINRRLGDLEAKGNRDK